MPFLGTSNENSKSGRDVGLLEVVIVVSSSSPSNSLEVTLMGGLLLPTKPLDEDIANNRLKMILKVDFIVVFDIMPQ